MESKLNEFETLKGYINRDEHQALAAYLSDRKNKDLVNKRDIKPYRGRTLLHHAVMAAKPQCVKALLDCGAKTFIADFDFKTPMQLASDTGYEDQSKASSSYDCLKHLIKNLTKFTEADLDESLAIAIQSYKHAPKGSNVQNLVVATGCVSLLVGVDLLPDLHHNQVKFFGHMHSIKGSIKNKWSDKEATLLEGWSTGKFLTTRLRILFQLLVKLSWCSDTDSRARFRLVKQEFCVTIETFQIYAARKLFVTVPSLRLDQLNSDLAQNVMGRIRALEIGELVLAAGWDGHALYVAYQKRDNDIIKRIDNLGEGVGYDNNVFLPACHNLSKDEYYSYFVSKTAQSRFSQDFYSELTYIQDCNNSAMPIVYTAAAITEALQKDEVRKRTSEIWKKLYALESASQEPQSERARDFKLPFLPLQTVGNCTLESYQLGGKNRTQQHYTWLNAEECALANPSFTKNGVTKFVRLESRYLSSPMVPFYIKNNLRQHFREKYTTLPSVTRDKTFKIKEHIVSLANHNPSIYREDEQERQREYYSNAHVNSGRIDLASLVQPNQKERQSVVIVGQVGLGKTTLCLHILHQWASFPRERLKRGLGDKFNLFCHVKLRNLSEERYPKAEAPYSLNDIIQRECFEGVVSNLQLGDKLDELIRNDKVLWLLDGFDELALPDHLQEVWHELLELARCRLVTTRPYRMPDFETTKTVGLVPYQQDDIDRFVTNYFTDAAMSASLSKFIQSAQAIRPHIRTPGNLSMLCMLWENDHEQLKVKSTITITQLFYEFLKVNARSHLSKMGVSVDHLKKLGEIFAFANTTLKCYQKLAYYMKLNNQREVSEERLLTYLGKSNAPNAIAKMLEYGFLVETGASTDRYYVFSHSSFLDFFCAMFLYHKLSSKYFKDVLSLIGANKYENNYALVLRFLSGFVHQSFDGIAVSDKAVRLKIVSNFWKSVEQSPCDISYYYHTKLLIAFLQEIPSQTIVSEHSEKLKTISNRSLDELQRYHWGTCDCSVDLHQSSKSLIDHLIQCPVVLELLAEKAGFFDAIMNRWSLDGGLKSATAIKVLSGFVGSVGLDHQAFKLRLLSPFKCLKVTIANAARGAFTQLASEEKLTVADINWLLDSYLELPRLMKIFTLASKVIATDVHCVGQVLTAITDKAVLDKQNLSPFTGKYRFDSGLQAYLDIVIQLSVDSFNPTFNEILKQTLIRLVTHCDGPEVDFYDSFLEPDVNQFGYSTRQRCFVTKILFELISKKQENTLVAIFTELTTSLEKSQVVLPSTIFAVFSHLALLVQHPKLTQKGKDTVVNLLEQYHQRTSVPVAYSDDESKAKDTAVQNSIIIVFLTFLLPAYQDQDKSNKFETLFNKINNVLMPPVNYDNRPLQIIALKALAKIAEPTNLLSNNDVDRIKKLLNSIPLKHEESNWVSRDHEYVKLLKNAFLAYQLPYPEMESNVLSDAPPSVLNSQPSTVFQVPYSQVLQADIKTSFDAFVGQPTDDNAAALLEKITRFNRKPCIIVTADALRLGDYSEALNWPPADKLKIIECFLWRCFSTKWRLLSDVYLSSMGASRPVNNNTFIFDPIGPIPRLAQEIVASNKVISYEDVTTQWQFFSTVPAAQALPEPTEAMQPERQPHN